VLAFWFWRGNEPGWLIEGIGDKKSGPGPSQLLLGKDKHETSGHY
jgi:hypothetical protein